MITGLAHRGYPKKVPENTIASFQAALDLSYSHLELDVQLTKDGVPVVIHDTTVNRTTNGRGRVMEFTFDELRKLDAGAGQRIPTLEEVLQLAKGKAKVDIELKQSGNMYPGLEQKVLDVVHSCGVNDQVFVTSFDHYSIVRMRELSREIELGLVLYGATPSVFPLAKQIDARYVSVKYIYLTDEFVQHCDEQGIQLIAWTIDDEQDMRDLRSRYPHIWACTNELERWKQCIETFGSTRKS
ncbi:glycerophosphoryl diester phosphodiesterase [Paenibacillus sp. V4I3]|uniref:glycerophosphodiester phosphodiesterase n=1 Tax=unclassified Paenibacillus TaxID=185978 RepID=UPI002786B8B5|nr:MULTISPECIES: glycerophosphodiester phosphodiesterase family protein [unclassified Paenibacillus]MDQ0878678.1 glycerophosphoryl diester phosphodiesterase [Paenibacillus sp. V4I3]MDQ0885465.1 glycerophosphoryl diester phosphodiesterase [Paenibacillus sp. V4I9]